MKKIWLLGFSVTALFLFVACDQLAKSDPTAADYCQQGWEQFQNGQFSNAATSFQKALDVDPDYVDTYLGLGLTRLRLDDFPGAKSALNTAKTKSPTFAQSIAISVIVSFVYVKENDANSIVAELINKIIDTDDWTFGHGIEIDAVDIHNLLCEAYIMIRIYGSESDSAINAHDGWGQVKKSIELDPQDEKALDLRALLRSEG